MDRQFNFNMQATGYVPKNLRQTQQEKPKYDNSNVEVVINNQGVKGIQGDQGYKASQYYNQPDHKYNKDYNQNSQ